MDRDLPKLIGYAALAIVAYQILQMIFPILFFGLIVCAVLWVLQEYLKHKK